uniref:Glycosyltransferase n=1 Tax=Rhizophora mucronata TaxID=61149 RepID=A0A2P2NY13_RHIMU
MEVKVKSGKAHVLVVPFPGQGHINPMLQFSRRLVSKELKVTFVTTNFISTSKQLGSSIGSVQLDTISDGYDDGRPAGTTMESYLSRLHGVGPRSLLKLIEKYQSSTDPIDCIIYEPFMAWALDIAKHFGLLAAAFFTHACAVDYIFYSFHSKLLMLPVTSTPVSISGLPILLELQDLPSFIAAPGSYPANFNMTMSQFSNMDKADFILINTFYKLENEAVETMSKCCPLLTIGPTIPSIYLDNGVENDDDYGLDLVTGDAASISINWLGTKPAGSVVYVSFGSFGRPSKKQLEEISWGLKRSSFYFLWGVKATDDDEEPKVPPGFVEEEVAAKGLAVNWVPQVKVLASGAVGCFLTHCGWNSTIEALSLGVPMVAMPLWSDQPTNAKLVEDVWKVGIRAKPDENGIVNREEIEFCVRQVMEDEKRGKEMRENSKKWKQLAIEACSQGGTSDRSISDFVSKLPHR